MDVVDSSLEAAAAFNLLNLAPLLTNLWACLAVLTAALSFWRLRSSSPSPTTTTTTQTTPSTISPNTTSVVKRTTSVVKRTTSFEKREEEGVLTRGNSSKELFTAVYNENIMEEERENEDDDEVDGGDESVVKKWAVEIRGAGDLGWYCYQDRTVIGGNVVRLWDEERENTSPKSCRRRSSALASSLVFT